MTIDEKFAFLTRIEQAIRATLPWHPESSLAVWLSLFQ